MVRELHCIYAALDPFNAALNSKLFLVLVESIDHYLPVIRACREEITAAHICCTQDPRIIFVQTFQAVNWLFLVHDPQVHCVVRRCSHEKLVVYDVHCVSAVSEIVIQQFCILIDFPENALSVQTA